LLDALSAGWIFLSLWDMSVLAPDVRQDYQVQKSNSNLTTQLYFISNNPIRLYTKLENSKQ
jgi:hypothetical protein